MNVASMNDAQRAARSSLSVLSLESAVINDRPDWPVIRFLVNGRDPFAAIAPGWRGFDPEKMLGPGSPLLPVDPGRRVAVYCCSCAEPACGVIAPVIVASPDGRRVTWTDFRDYTGVFTSPVIMCDNDDDGHSWGLPDLHFDREQYVAEIGRATRDRSWETGRRKTARLLYDRLEPLRLVLPPDLGLAGVVPAWKGDGIALMFRREILTPVFESRQQVLRLTSELRDPDQAAEDMARRLLSASPHDWLGSFGYH